MNATEDGEPLGEAPELPRAQYDHETAEYLAWLCKWPESPVGYSLTEPGHIENIPVLGENERQAIAEIRELHKPCTCRRTFSGLTVEPCDLCDGCEREYPCDTIRLLDARGL